MTHLFLKNKALLTLLLIFAPVHSLSAGTASANLAKKTALPSGSSVRDVPAGALVVWNQLAQRSIEVPGVCWVQINTIAEAAGVSRSTVERAIRLFKKLGVIEVKETIRPKTGGDGANIYVFQKLGEGAEMKGREDTPKPCPTSVEGPESKNDTKISLDLDKYINHLNTTRTPYIKYVPKSLQHFQAFFGKRIKDIYARVWLAAKKLGLKIDQATMQQIGFIAMETLKRYAKEGKSLSEEQQYKCAYVIAYKQLQQRIDNGEIIDFNNLYGSLLKKISMKKVYSPMLKNEDYTQLDELGVY